MNKVVKNNMLRYEDTYSKYATKNEDAIRLVNIKEDMRPAFFRDADRIIYCKSYSRYLDKTQVFSNLENDHISKRIIHVNMVSKIARTIGRALNLNEDLIEAIALGHDLGHVPFGHTGEAILNEISYEYDKTYFNHNVQSVRLLKDVEKNGRGHNLTVQVLDGILCHNGEMCLQEYKPMSKTKEDFLREYEQCYVDKEINTKLRPMTLEGCVVRISDVIAYIGRDIEDAKRIGVLNDKDIPNNVKEVLGDTNTKIINSLILDIVENSLDKPYIKLSEKVYNALEELKAFNYKNIYNKANTKEQLNEYRIMFNTLFNTYVNQINNNETEEDIFKVFLDDMDQDYINKTNDNRKAIDFIAGMTDAYFINQYNKTLEKKMIK